MYDSDARGRSPHLRDRVTIKDVCANDAEFINSLHNEVIGEGKLPWIKSRTIQQTQDWLSLLAVHNYPCLVALEGDELIGVAAFLPLEREVVPGHCVEYTVSLLCLIKQNYRNQGLGSRMFERLANHKLSEEGQYYLVISE